MNVDAIICQECPTPIQWQQLRRHYVGVIQLYIDTTDTRIAKFEEEISMLYREVARESSLRYKIAQLLETHNEMLSEGKAADNELRELP